jgi:hypothetical protein
LFKLPKTQPDGLWLYLRPDDGYADAVAIEVSRSIQNLNDKRSRYMPATYGLVVDCPKAWLLAEIRLRFGRRQQRWQAAATFDRKPTTDLTLQVRLLRVLYSLPNDLYRTWLPGHVPAGHEYFTPHTSLASYNSQAMQQFLSRLTWRSHLYVLPGRA